MDDDPTRTWLTVDQAIERLAAVDRSPATIRPWISDGYLSAHKIRAGGFTDDPLDLLNAVGRLVKLHSTQDQVLNVVLEGPLVSGSDVLVIIP